MTSLLGFLGLLSLKDSSLIYSYSSGGLLLFFFLFFSICFSNFQIHRDCCFFYNTKTNKKQKTKRNDTRKKIESKIFFKKTI